MTTKAEEYRFDLVNPQFRGALEELLQHSPRTLDATSLPQLREFMRSFSRPLLPTPAVAERLIPGPQGAPDVRVYIVGNSTGASKPAVLHIHGGGFVSSSAGIELRNAQELAVAMDCVVLSVDYRLAPETRFPGSLEDNYAALRWLYLHAEELGVDRTRIAIKGESAGGGHAAALAIAARDRGEVPIALQVLIYPMLDDRTRPSRRRPLHPFVWTPAMNRFGWTALLGQPAGSASPPHGAVPARVRNLAGLPPTFIGVGAIDLFAAEDTEYAQRLVNAGVATELVIVPGAFHAFDAVVPQAELSQEFTALWHDALRCGLGLPSRQLNRQSRAPES